MFVYIASCCKEKKRRFCIGHKDFLNLYICHWLYPISTRRHFDVHTTSITLKRRRMDVKTTLCAYWVYIKGNRSLTPYTMLWFLKMGQQSREKLSCCRGFLWALFTNRFPTEFPILCVLIWLIPLIKKW